MNIRNYLKIGLSICISMSFNNANAQEPIKKGLNLNEAIQLALQNHQQLKISQANLELAQQQVKVAKLQRLPAATFSANGFYMSDATLYDSKLSKLTEIEMPHFGNTYGLQASQLLYKGGLIIKTIEMAELRVQLSELDLQKDLQAIKFLIISNYLDIYKLHNQLRVYEQNKALAEVRLTNIKNMYEQEMLTRNEVLRSELQIKNLEQVILTINNNLTIMSNQMSYALGLPENILIIPTEQVENKMVLAMDQYIELAHKEHIALKTANANISMAQKSKNITKTELYPTIAGFYNYNMQRPLTTSQPAMDYYANTWQTGISITYNIDNIFKTRQKIKQSEKQVNIMEEIFTLTEQNINLGVRAAYNKYQEAIQQEIISNKTKELASENYRIVESKYLNQLAITAEMTDATNAKLEADLQNANAGINVLFQYYNILKSAGTL